MYLCRGSSDVTFLLLLLLLLLLPIAEDEEDKDDAVGAVADDAHVCLLPVVMATSSTDEVITIKCDAHRHLKLVNSMTSRHGRERARASKRLKRLNCVWSFSWSNSNPRE